MRLGLLGPAHDHDEALEEGARLLLDQGVDRAVYLGVDHALDHTVQRWAEALVGGDPRDEALFARATSRCARATPAEIDAFLAAERQRRALAVLESLPAADTRLVEILDGKLVVMLHDKALLDEEDILPAALLVFGKGTAPLVKQVGSRWFLSPGPLGEFGIMTLEDADDGIHLTLLDRFGAEVRRERLLAGRGAKLKVTGAR